VARRNEPRDVSALGLRHGPRGSAASGADIAAWAAHMHMHMHMHICICTCHMHMHMCMHMCWCMCMCTR
jgi:hypothetical protein